LNKETVREQIVAKIAEQFKKDPATVRNEDNLAKEYGAKSHDLIRLSASIQATLGIKIGYAQARKVNTVSEWVDLAASLVK